MLKQLMGTACIIVSGVALAAGWSHPTSDRVEQGLEECWTLNKSTGEVAEITCNELYGPGDVSEDIHYFSTHFDSDFRDGGCLIVASTLMPGDQGPHALTLNRQRVSYEYMEGPYGDLACIEAYYTESKVSVAGAFR